MSAASTSGESWRRGGQQREVVLQARDDLGQAHSRRSSSGRRADIGAGLLDQVVGDEDHGHLGQDRSVTALRPIRF